MRTETIMILQFDELSDDIEVDDAIESNGYEFTESGEFHA